MRFQETVHCAGRVARRGQSLAGCLLLALVLLLGVLPESLAQNNVMKGMDKKQILERFGQPDERRGNGSREAWLFGKSIIFFEGERVSAWTDSGELRGRENLAAIRDEKRSDYELFSRGWVNPWTPRAPIQPEDVMKEILDSPAVKESAEAPADAGHKQNGAERAGPEQASPAPSPTN